MRRLSSVAWVAVLLAASTGCQGMAPHLARPNLASPGTAEAQQARAVQFDPYPENETGPRIVGGRPLEYQQPPAEVFRARWLPWNW